MSPAHRVIIMSIAGKNYIAGLWQAGESEVENRNPSDLSDLIGVYDKRAVRNSSKL